MHTPVNRVPKPTPARTASSALAATIFWILTTVLVTVLPVAAQTGATSSAPSEKGSVPGESEKGSAPGEADDQWLPAFAIATGVIFQQQEASVASFDITHDVPLRDPDDGRIWAIAPYLGINLELASPVVAAIPGRPRFFVNAELLPAFGASLDIAKEGDPKGFIVPEINIDPIASCPFGFGCFDQESITGVGSRTTAQIQPLAFAAHAGLTVPFEAFGRKLHLKPSIGWFRYTVKVDGRVLSGLKPATPVPDYRLVTLEGKKTRSFDAIGPGLELELDVGRYGPVAPSLYIEGHAYHLLGDRKVKIRKRSGVLQCPPPPDATAFCGALLPPADYAGRWSFEANSWMYRGGIGMRFRWIGF